MKNKYAKVYMKDLINQIIAMKDMIRYAECELYEFGYGYCFLISELREMINEYLRFKKHFLYDNVIDCMDVVFLGDMEVRY
jgi:hypothetical protein